MVTITRYDSKHRIIERTFYATDKFIEAIDCATDSHHHEKYQWDEKDRLIYYSNGASYKKISYTSYGKFTEVYDRETGKLVALEPRFVSESNGVITISTNSSQITLMPLERGSKLYKLKTVAPVAASADYIPMMEYYEIVYK